MQLILVIYFTILTFVAWTLEIDSEQRNITGEAIQNDENTEEERADHVKYEKEYEKALKLSFLFFEAQRSGELPPDNRIKWRNNSMLDDRGIYGENLSGGYYHSGLTYIKYVFPTAFTTTMLAWGLLTWPKAYMNAGQRIIARRTIKWATKYFIKCHAHQEVFYIQVGNKNFEFRFFGRPEKMSYNRPAYAANFTHPASDILAETAAALAATSIVFKDIFHDIRYSSKCLVHAKQLYRFALKYPGSHYEWMPANYDYEVNGYGYGDDLAWAALWLYRATKNPHYLMEAKEFYTTYRLATIDTIFNYYSKIPGIEMMFAELTRSSYHREAVELYFDTVIHNAKRTKKGLVFLSNNDTLSLAANAAFLCLVAVSSDIKDRDRCYTFAKQQIDYILGIESGRSYVVGFGENPPTYIRHKASLCPNLPAFCRFNDVNHTEPNQQILYGALVNGPDIHDNFIDTRSDTAKLHTKVRIDYNAGFTGALAGLLQLNTKSDVRVNSYPATHHAEAVSHDEKYDSLLVNSKLTKYEIIKILH